MRDNTEIYDEGPIEQNQHSHESQELPLLSNIEHVYVISTIPHLITQHRT